MGIDIDNPSKEGIKRIKHNLGKMFPSDWDVIAWLKALRKPGDEVQKKRKKKAAAKKKERKAELESEEDKKNSKKHLSKKQEAKKRKQIESSDSEASEAPKKKMRPKPKEKKVGELKQKMMINGNWMDMNIDTGCDYQLCIPQHLYEGPPPVKQKGMKVHSPGGEVDIIGTIDLPVTILGVTKNLEAVIINNRNMRSGLFGWPAQNKFGLRIDRRQIVWIGGE
eukprot:350950_1